MKYVADATQVAALVFFAVVIVAVVKTFIWPGDR